MYLIQFLLVWELESKLDVRKAGFPGSSAMTILINRRIPENEKADEFTRRGVRNEKQVANWQIGKSMATVRAKFKDNSFLILFVLVALISILLNTL